MEASLGQETDGGMGGEEAWVERRHGLRGGMGREEAWVERRHG
jgi:hypothetical protein